MSTSVKSVKTVKPAKPEPGTIDFHDPKYYTNRELSWLDFNERILGEARDHENPLFERIKFLSIVTSNMDEFFSVRVASLKDQVNAEYTKPDLAGMTPQMQLDAISVKAHAQISEQYSTYNRSIVPQLKANGLEIINGHEDLSEEQMKFCDRYFEEEVYPVLTPMAMDSARPFPLIRNKTLNIGALISRKGDKAGKKQFATVQVPSVLSRIIELPKGENGERYVILLEQLIEYNIEKLFTGYEVVCAFPYRIIRNADLTIDEDEASDLLREIQKQLKKTAVGRGYPP